MKTAIFLCVLLGALGVPAGAAEALPKGTVADAAKLLEEGRFEDAAFAFERLSTELRPGDHRAGGVWRGLGVSYANLGETEKAIDAFLQSIESDPRSMVARVYLGACYRLDDRTLEAISVFIEALRIDPEFERVHDELWQSYEVFGDLYGYDAELAARKLYHIGKLLEIDPEYAKGLPRILDEIKYMRILLARFRAGETGRVRRAAAANPENAPALPDDGISPEEREAGLALAEKF